jgi:DNA-binding SARP family transcriptional activator
MTPTTADRSPRERLVNRLLDGRVGVVEAAAGYGKSTLAAALGARLSVSCASVPLGSPDDDVALLAASIRRGLHNARLSDLAAAMGGDNPAVWIDRLLDGLADRGDPVLFVVDDAHHLQKEAPAALLVRLARGLRPPHRLLVTARRLPAPLQALKAVPEVILLGTEDMEFTAEETAELLGRRAGGGVPDEEVRWILDATEGWAAALDLAATAVAKAIDAGTAYRSMSSGRDVIGSLLRGLLDQASTSLRAGVTQLGHLPFISAELADDVCGMPEALDQLVSAGIPLTRLPTGWWEMPTPVSAWLSARGPISAATASAAAGHYAAAGEIAAATRTLLVAGMGAEAASLVVHLGPAELDDLTFAELHGLVAALPSEAVDQHPKVLLHLARAAETSYRRDLRAEAIERAAELAEATNDPSADALRHEVRAEQARDLLWDETTWERARALAQSVIDECDSEELRARARALDVLGRLASWMSTVGVRAEAEPLLEEAAQLDLHVGQTTWAAQALVVLAMGVHFADCRYQRAIETLDRALAVLPYRTPYRALIQSFRCDVLSEMGQFAQVESCLEQMDDTFRATRESWIPFFRSWGEAVLASYSGDRERTVRAVLTCEQAQGAISDRVSQSEFLAQAADLLDRVGENAMGAERLELARAAGGSFEGTFKVFEAIVAGRSGEPGQAIVLIDEVLARPDLESQERWPLLVARASAAQRAGDARVAAWAAEAFETAASLGNPEGPMVRDRDAALVLLPLAATSSPAASRLLHGVGQITVSLLGRFEVSRGGRSLRLPPGRPAKAVRAVAASGGWIHAEVLQEILWPESDVATARNRMRNVLSRLRSAAGELLVRDGDGIALADGTVCDLVEFDVHARRARDAIAAGDPGGAAAWARSALANAKEDLLPDDRYETWAEEPRQRFNAARLELIDAIAGEAEDRADVDEAIRQVERAIELQRYDEVRYVRLATLLASQGRIGSARDTLRRARAVLDELDLDPSTSLEQLQATLGAASVPG